jgi:hypothetical protein
MELPFPVAPTTFYYDLVSLDVFYQFIIEELFNFKNFGMFRIFVFP